jgi:hypothetical protein
MHAFEMTASVMASMRAGIPSDGALGLSSGLMRISSPRSVELVGSGPGVDWPGSWACADTCSSIMRQRGKLWACLNEQYSLAMLPAATQSPSYEFRASALA